MSTGTAAHLTVDVQLDDDSMVGYHVLPGPDGPFGVLLLGDYPGRVNVHARTSADIDRITKALAQLREQLSLAEEHEELPAA